MPEGAGSNFRRRLGGDTALLVYIALGKLALNLAALGLAFPGDPETVDISRKALQDKSPWCRIYGAANLGSEGKALLNAEVDGAKDPVEAIRRFRSAID